MRERHTAPRNQERHKPCATQQKRVTPRSDRNPRSLSSKSPALPVESTTSGWARTDTSTATAWLGKCRRGSTHPSGPASTSVRHRPKVASPRPPEAQSSERAPAGAPSGDSADQEMRTKMNKSLLTEDQLHVINAFAFMIGLNALLILKLMGEL